MNPLKDRDSVETEFGFKQRVVKEETSGMGWGLVFIGVIIAMGVVGMLQVDNGGSRQRNDRGVDSSSLVAPFNNG